MAFPDTVWSGNRENGKKSPDGTDWQSLVKEVQAIEVYVKTLSETITNLPSLALDLDCMGRRIEKLVAELAGVEAPPMEALEALQAKVDAQERINLSNGALMVEIVKTTKALRGQMANLEATLSAKMDAAEAAEETHRLAVKKLIGGQTSRVEGKITRFENRLNSIYSLLEGTGEEWKNA
jgi:hypothetical protein